MARLSQKRNRSPRPSRNSEDELGIDNTLIDDRLQRLSPVAIDDMDEIDDFDPRYMEAPAEEPHEPASQQLQGSDLGSPDENNGGDSNEVDELRRQIDPDSSGTDNSKSQPSSSASAEKDSSAIAGQGSNPKWEFLLTANSEMLAEVLDRVAELRESVDYVASTHAINLSTGNVSTESVATTLSSTETNDVNSETDDSEIDHAQINLMLQDEIHTLRKELEIMEQQNTDLASQIADTNVKRTVSQSGGTSETMTWEERKEMILKQMEDDSFDAEVFLDDLQGKSSVTGSQEVTDPITFVEQLHDELMKERGRAERHESELHELQTLLQQQDSDASSLAAVVDADTVVQAERSKLRELKADWEERFRESEIAASLERAKLSRERQQLELENAKLQEQLAQVARRADQFDADASSAPSRRWLAKLGIAETDEE